LLLEGDGYPCYVGYTYGKHIQKIPLARCIKLILFELNNMLKLKLKKKKKEDEEEVSNNTINIPDINRKG
jgi:hypothetical protein